MTFYEITLRRLVEKGLFTPHDHVLIAGGGELDGNVFSVLGFHNVLITNLEPHAGHTEYAPYTWQRADIEALDFASQSFDWVVEHAALHHLESPHRGLLEMLRVARKGVLVFEARDSTLMRMAASLGISSEFELESAFLSKGTAFGQRQSTTPNYVYRWTEREVEKTVYQRYPAYQHRFHYFYGLSVPVQRFKMARNPIYGAIGFLLNAISPLISLVLRRQGNSFSFVIEKNVKLQPWMSLTPTGELQPDFTYLEKKYDRDAYQRRPEK